MVNKAVSFHKADADAPIVGPVQPGRVDDTIRAMLGNRPNEWLVQLCRYNDKGTVTWKSPWRKPHEADEHFAPTILDAPVGAFFRVEGRLKRLFAAKVVESTEGQRAVEYARSEIGTPYRFGIANGPEDPGTDAFDCSGLTQWAWQQATNGRVQLPHSAAAQKFQGKAVDGLGSSQQGDLVTMWFPNSRGIRWPTASHVGLYYDRTVSGPRMLDTRNPFGEPVAVRYIETGNVVAIRRP